MLRKEFEINMKNRFGCDRSLIEKWISFSEENVRHNQYVNFTPEPNEQAVQRWLEHIFSSLYFVQRQAGNKVVNDILNLSREHCLYPDEIMGVIEHLKEGGSTENLIEKSLNGELDYDIKSPNLDDVKIDLMENARKKPRER